MLPVETPEALAISGVGGLKIKDYFPEPAGKMRRWNVLLEDARRGEVRLAIDFQQPLPSQELKGIPMPIVRADGVAHQSGLASVEGSADLEVQVRTDARRVDIGQLAASNYQPGRRLLGVYEFVGRAPPVVDRCRAASQLSPLFRAGRAGRIQHALVGRRRQPDPSPFPPSHQGPLS